MQNGFPTGPGDLRRVAAKDVQTWVVDTMERLTPPSATGESGATEPKKTRKRKSAEHGNGQVNVRPAEPLIAEPHRAEAPRSEVPRAEPPRAEAPRPESHRPDPRPAEPARAKRREPRPRVAPRQAEPRQAEPRQPEPRREPPAASSAGASAQTAAAGAGAQTTVNVEAFSKNIARMVEQSGRALAAYLKPREEGRTSDEGADMVADAVKTLGHVMQYWMADPQRAVQMRASLGQSYLDLWASAAKRMAGEDAPPVAKPDPRDKRFSDPEWSSNQFFDFMKQGYLLSADWANRLVRDAEGLDPHERHKAAFYMRQITNAVAPSNFLLTNPELLRTTFASNAENLVDGMRMLAEDIEAGGGSLKIRQSDSSMFEVGRNLGVTPGKVIYQNDLMQLIQYTPTTPDVLKRPLLIVPPWINKFYILDLTPEKSFIKWCVSQGLTVFVISWVNPDARLQHKDLADYMHEGPLEALDVIKRITGEDEVTAIGYCVGGTLLAIALAYMAARDDHRIGSATFFAAQTDFTHAGDLKVFVDDDQIATLEKHMHDRGYLEGKSMATAFNLLRSNDLIWPYVINNYLKGKAPFPFDLLYWNSDATRMPAANHSQYLRGCYLENRLATGKMDIEGTTLDLRKVKAPIYNLATREDHIAPPRSVLLGSSLFGGPVKYVLAGSGHIAGVINPPARAKYQYWTGPRPQGDDVDKWLKQATEHPGSWWPDWIEWIKAQSPALVPAREPGGGVLPPLEDSPGSYVKVRD
jgi:polyhydroxyalkanoate synthase